MVILYILMSSIETKTQEKNLHNSGPILQILCEKLIIYDVVASSHERN